MLAHQVGPSGQGVAVAMEQGGVRMGGRTDADGRVSAIGPETLERGAYVLRFDTGTYVDGFYPEVVVVFTIADPGQHYHVPVLLNPFGYGTYRGT